MDVSFSGQFTRVDRVMWAESPRPVMRYVQDDVLMFCVILNEFISLLASAFSESYRWQEESAIMTHAPEIIKVGIRVIGEKAEKN